MNGTTPTTPEELSDLIGEVSLFDIAAQIMVADPEIQHMAATMTPDEFNAASTARFGEAVKEANTVLAEIAERFLRPENREVTVREAAARLGVHIP